MQLERGLLRMPPVQSSALTFALAALLAGSAVSCGGAAAQAKRNSEQKPEIAVVRVTREDLAKSLTVSSELVPFQQIDVYAKESGFVQKLYVDYGTHVKTGQVMAVLEIPELQIQLDEDQAEIEYAKNQIDRVEEQLRAITAEQKVTHLQFSRLDEVAKAQNGLVAQQEVDNWQGKDLAATAQLAGAQAALESAKNQLLRAKEKQRHDAAIFDYSKITAPFGGVVTKRYANLGTLVQSGMNSSTQVLPLVQLSQDNLFRLVIPVSESYAPGIKIGDPVDVRVPALDQDLTGKVARLSFDLEMSTRTMHTEVDVPNPQTILMPGMYAEATLKFDRRKHVLAVPPQAANIEGDNRSVWVVDPTGKVEHRAVTLGVETPDSIEVLTGLKEGELVAVGDRSHLRTGEMVQPKEIELLQYKAAPTE
jgi:RND family efflux transporter MFP subunit